MTQSSAPKPRLTKYEIAEIRSLDRLIAQLKLRRSKVKARANTRTDHWRKAHQ